MTNQGLPGEILPGLEERSRLELALPAHVLALMAHELRRQGWELRADIDRYLNNAAVLPLVGLDELGVARLAGRIDDAARLLLHDLTPDDARPAILTVAHFVLRLVDEEMFDDPRNPAVLTALLLIEEARGDALWASDEAASRRSAGRLLGRANMLGLYCR